VTPDLLFFRDTDGDGVADEKEAIFSGFGKERSRLNMQALPNSLRWGLDNRIYGVTSSNGAVLSRPGDSQSGTLQLRGSDFSFDPESLDLRMEMGGGQHGASFDDVGYRYVCSNSRHIQRILYDARYASNSLFSLPNARISIAVDGDAAPVFRISPDEPWRIVRTRWRIAGKVRGPVEGGGRVSGYFTAATGVTIYQGDLFGEDFSGNAFIADTGSNLVHRKILQPGSDIYSTAIRPISEQDSEFLASPDNWFRPVQLANGPDGALYILDMYREVIEHPWSLPEGIKSFLDLDSGNDRGRIWRVVPENHKHGCPQKLSGADSRELVGFLSSKNAWTRKTASRLLYERQDGSVVPDLSMLAKRGSEPLGRLQALYALSGMGALKKEHVLEALTDEVSFIRQHGLRLSESFLLQGNDTALSQAALKLAEDPSIEVRYQLALTLSLVKVSGEVEALVSMMKREPSAPTLHVALLHALSTQADELFAYCEAHSMEATSVLSMASSFQAGGRALQTLQAAREQYLRQLASSICEDSLKPSPARLKSAQLLGVLDQKRAVHHLKTFLESKDSSLQNGAVSSLLQLKPAGMTEELLERWKSLSSGSRQALLAYILRSEKEVPHLLKAMESGRIDAKELSLSQKTSLRNLKNEKLLHRALVLVGKPAKPAKIEPRQNVIERYLPALNLKGKASSGKNTFQQRCALCHKAKDFGHALGPDILSNLIHPNREIAADFEAYHIRTKDEVHLGLLGNETPTHLSIRFPSGQSVTLLRKEVLGMKSLGHSIMPENLEIGLSLQDMADLLEFLME
jgi:putative membrane-bound dehydrogenase-like protein